MRNKKGSNLKNAKQQYILLLGANYRAMFYVARKFYHNNYKVDVIDWEDIPIVHSKYINEYYQINNEVINDVRTILTNILSKHKYDAIVPINDVGVLLSKYFFDDISSFAPIIMSNSNSLVYAYNKYELYKQSIKCGFGEYLISLITNKNDLYVYLNGIDYSSIVIKSCYSKNIVNNHIESYSVYKSEDKKDIINRFSNENEFPLMVQQCIKGQEIGFNFIAINGVIKAYYIDEAHSGNFGTECISRKSIQEIPQLTEKIKNLVKLINWNGVGMFDIIVNGDDFYILELNGRFWASIDLSDITKSGIWETYESVFIKHNPAILQMKNYGQKGFVLINFQSAVKKILRDITHPNHWNSSLKIFFTLTKTIFCKRHFIQERFWDDKSFYFHLLNHYIKRI